MSRRRCRKRRPAERDRRDIQRCRIAGDRRAVPPPAERSRSKRIVDRGSARYQPSARTNSLLRARISLFRCVGNSIKKSRKTAPIQLGSRPIRPDFAKIPCIFPHYQGIRTEAEFDPDCAHRQPVSPSNAPRSMAREFLGVWGMGPKRSERRRFPAPTRTFGRTGEVLLRKRRERRSSAQRAPWPGSPMPPRPSTQLQPLADGARAGKRLSAKLPARE